MILLGFAAIICTTGRTQEDFDEQGTGDRVVLQNGDALTTIPPTESDVADTDWTNGQCFFSMGVRHANDSI